MTNVLKHNQKSEKTHSEQDAQTVPSTLPFPKTKSHILPQDTKKQDWTLPLT